jgi:hypothetical protein
MGFKIEGEVVIDARKGTTALKSVQHEATKTSRAFDNAGTSTKHLAKSLLHLGSAGTNASHSFMQLARLGTAGIIGAAAIGAVNKFGEAVKNSATDYYETQKSLADAFETSFKSTSVEEARKGLEATADIADKLKGKITQLGTLGKIMGGLEKLTGINLGFGDTEKELKTAQSQLVIQEEILRIRQRELEIATQTSEEMEITAKNSRRLRAELDAEEGVTSKNVLLASQLTDEVATRIAVLKQERADLDGLADSENKRLLIAKNANAIYEQQTSLIVANTKLEKAKADEAKKAQGLSGGLLGASKGGQQALEAARKTQGRQNKQADFKAQEAVFGNLADVENKKRAAQGITTMVTPSDMKRKMAEQQAAREAPSLANQIQGQATGVDASQIASQQAQARFEKQSMGMTSDLGPKTGKLGVEAQSQTADVMKAITALVDLMKSATLVN